MTSNKKVYKSKKVDIPDTHHCWSHRCQSCALYKEGRMYVVKLLHGDKFGVYCTRECYLEARASKVYKCAGCHFKCAKVKWINDVAFCAPCLKTTPPAETNKRVAAAASSAMQEEDDDGDVECDCDDDVGEIPENWDGQWASL